MALSTAPVSANELTQEQVQAILVTPLVQASVFLSAGPRIFDVTAAGKVRIPKMTGVIDPAWHGENEAITEQDPAFGEVVLLDGTKSLKVITRFSNELARSSVVALDAAIRDRLVTDVAGKLDAALLAGDGANSTPVGLVNYTGTQVMTAVGDPTLDKLLDALGLLLAANVDPKNAKWVMRSETFIKLRKAKDTAGKFLIDADLNNGLTFNMFGCPILVSNRIPKSTGTTPTTTMALVDFSKIAVARDMAPSVKLLQERYADHDQQALRVVARYDAKPLNEEAVVLMRGVTV